MHQSRTKEYHTSHRGSGFPLCHLSSDDIIGSVGTSPHDWSGWTDREWSEAVVMEISGTGLCLLLCILAARFTVFHSYMRV